MIIDGKLVTTDLTKINMGFEEFVSHSYYDEWTSSPPRFQTDPIGNPISPYNPWNKITIPRPTAKNFKEKYTWDTAPRWDRRTIETGTYGRMWTTALSGRSGPSTNPFVEATGDGLRMVLPRHELPEDELYWKVPRSLCALERNRARAYAMAFTSAIGMNIMLKALEYWRRGDTEVHTPYKIPKDERIGVGFLEAGRGWLVHHNHIDKGKIVNYQITTPSTLNAAPRDPFGGLGPYEQGVVDTPILESMPDDDIKGIDVLRAIRSFDPCMPCTTHMDTGKGVIVREVNSCGCTLE
jgi:hydrogenase large subunit